MTPFDARQLQQMLKVISAVRRGNATLLDAANSLLFLRDALEQSSESWVDEFTTHVATLESAGTATASQIESMGSRYQLAIEQALAALEASVQGLAPNTSPEDDS